jgi:hypothetical protein
MFSYLNFVGNSFIWPLFVRKKINLTYSAVLNTTLSIKKRHPSVTGASKHDFFNPQISQITQIIMSARWGLRNLAGLIPRSLLR